MAREDLPPETLLYRRIPAVCGWVRSDGRVDLAAFLPNKGDSDGLSLTRVLSEREAAESGKVGKRFYAVSLRVADLRARGLSVKCDSSGHALIEGWTFETRQERHVREGAEYLITVCGKAVGPFDGKT